MPRVPESILIDEDGIKKIVNDMDAKAKEPKAVSLADFLEKLRKPAQKMLAAGYSYGDISQLLKERKIYIPAATIQRYLEGKETEVNEPGSQMIKSSRKKPMKSTDSPASIPGNESLFVEDEAEVKKIKAAQAKGFNMIDKDKL